MFGLRTAKAYGRLLEEYINDGVKIFELNQKLNNQLTQCRFLQNTVAQLKKRNKRLVRNNAKLGAENARLRKRLEDLQ